jgi:hypothetical protein
LFNNNFSLFRLPASVQKLFGLALFAAISLLSPAAWADITDGGTTTDASSLGDLFCNVFVNAWPFGTMCEWTAYVAGVALTIQGIYHFRGYTENPQNFPLHRAIMLWFGAMCLLALPNVVSVIIITLYGTALAGGGTGCTPGTEPTGGTTPDVMLTNMVNNIHGPLLSLISIISMICGIFMIVRGLMKASKYGFDPKAHSVHSILANIVFGALMLSIGENLNIIMTSVFGIGTGDMPDASAVLSWNFINAMGPSPQFVEAVTAALTFVQLIGAIAFVRGWLIMKKVVEGGGQVTMAQGITHILGGVCAINIYGFLQILDATL